MLTYFFISVRALFIVSSLSFAPCAAVTQVFIKYCIRKSMICVSRLAVIAYGDRCDILGSIGKDLHEIIGDEYTLVVQWIAFGRFQHFSYGSFIVGEVIRVGFSRSKHRTAVKT